MPIETKLDSIFDLNDEWPTAADPKSAGDDHLRNLKQILKITFPAFKGPMPIAHDQVASKDYVNQTAFNTVLPAQPGDATTYNLTSTGGSASWQPASIFDNDVMLAQAQALAFSV